MLQERLKIATKGNHDELEELMFVNEIMNKTFTREQYKTLLATNYIVHSAIESRLHEALDADLKTILEVDTRYKLAALEQDLEEMEISKADLDALDFDFLKSQDFNNASSLGAMYVLEGATLGGNVIQKKLKANPAFENLSLNYYTVYAQNLMPNWLSFVKVLNTSVPEADFAQAEESAVQLFKQIAQVSKTVKIYLS
jgi:heme oxygenase